MRGSKFIIFPKDGYIAAPSTDSRAIASRGLYIADNPNGLGPDTRLLAIGLGYHL
jgi:hypothetical protein